MSTQALQQVKEALEEITGCFEAAYIEGLSDALAETEDARLKDLVQRRILFANEAAQRALAALAAVSSEAQEPAKPCVLPNKFEALAGMHAWPEDLHDDTARLVVGFAAAMAQKLSAAQRKYGYTNGWIDKGWLDECRQHLLEHVAKGDPRDVANYCAFLWWHNEKTASPASDVPHRDVLENRAQALIRRVRSVLTGSELGGPDGCGGEYRLVNHYSQESLMSLAGNLNDVLSKFYQTDFSAPDVRPSVPVQQEPVAAQPQEQQATHSKPDVCPITRQPFFMSIDHPDLGPIPTYGGPFDSFGIPYLDDDGDLRAEHYDHDRGEWTEGGKRLGYYLTSEQPEDWRLPHWLDRHQGNVGQPQEAGQAVALATGESPLVVTKNGVPFADQAEGIQVFKDACGITLEQAEAAKLRRDIQILQMAAAKMGTDSTARMWEKVARHIEHLGAQLANKPTAGSAQAAPAVPDVWHELIGTIKLLRDHILFFAKEGSEFVIADAEGTLSRAAMLAAAPSAPSVSADALLIAAKAFAKAHIECDEMESRDGLDTMGNDIVSDYEYQTKTAAYNSTKAALLNAYRAAIAAQSKGASE